MNFKIRNGVWILYLLFFSVVDAEAMLCKPLDLENVYEESEFVFEAVVAERVRAMSSRNLPKPESLTIW